MDKAIEENETVLAHKLCGAGNGGFFLTFSKKNTLKLPFHCVKIYIEPNGVYWKSFMNPFNEYISSLQSAHMEVEFDKFKKHFIHIKELLS